LRCFIVQYQPSVFLSAILEDKLGTSGTLKDRITNSLDTLSPKHKNLARFILDNHYFTSFSSASQVGEKNDTTAATVVRFAQALGYQGYPELQEALRSELPPYMTAAARMQKRMSLQVTPSSTHQNVFYTDIQNIERTASSLSEQKLQAALEGIVKAARIFVIGAGISSVPAAFLVHSLKVMGFDVVAIGGEGLQTAVEIAQLRSNDLLIAVDLWRYARLTVITVSLAKEMGAPVIAITDSIVSPLAKKADISFEIATEGVAHSLSITALMSLLNVLVAMLADRVPEQVYESLQRVDATYRGNDFLIM
jgi:DNA-binding MurR/RpiR family transcriptional regulator